MVCAHVRVVCHRKVVPMFFERLKLLCAERGVSITSLVVNKLKMSPSNVTKWKEGKVPKSSTVSEIAAYFNVSTDYLLGKTDMKKPPAGSDEGLDANIKRLVELTSDFSPEEYQRLFEYADLLESARKKKLNE